MPGGDYLYIAGPVYSPENELVGAILVGRSTTTLVQGMREAVLGEENTFANITIYDTTG